MAASEKDYLVAAPDEQEYAFYSRYPKGSWSVGWPKEAEDLHCPHCDAEEIICLDDSGTQLGNRAQCWMCKREFTITENCWKFRKIR